MTANCHARVYYQGQSIFLLSFVFFYLFKCLLWICSVQIFHTVYSEIMISLLLDGGWTLSIYGHIFFTIAARLLFDFDFDSNVKIFEYKYILEYSADHLTQVTEGSQIISSLWMSRTYIVSIKDRVKQSVPYSQNV